MQALGRTGSGHCTMSTTCQVEDQAVANANKETEPEAGQSGTSQDPEGLLAGFRSEAQLISAKNTQVCS